MLNLPPRPPAISNPFTLFLVNCSSILADYPITLAESFSLVALGIVTGAIISNVALYFRLHYHEREQRPD